MKQLFLSILMLVETNRVHLKICPNLQTVQTSPSVGTIPSMARASYTAAH